MDIIIKRFGFKEGFTTRGGKIVEWPYSEPQPSQDDLDIWIAQDIKNNEIKATRKKELLRSTPQTITYEDNLANKSFNVNSDQHIPLFNAFINKLQERIDSGATNPTRNWTDSEGNRLALGIDDFRSLRNHLDERDEQQYDQAILKEKEIDKLSKSNKSKKDKIKNIEDFDITQVIVE
tara:strand:+ start:179 stop:712 length:534 start_codon:yes stop_codon:yes gene_type:complete